MTKEVVIQKVSFENYDFFEKNKWNFRFLGDAKHKSTYSKDTTKIGAVLAKEKREISSGYNGFPTGIDDSYERLSNREIKLNYVIHAEMNAILHANKAREKTNGSSIYIYGLSPCKDCAKHIVAAGVNKVYYIIRKDKVHTKEWGEQLAFVKDMFLEANIELIEFDENLLNFYEFINKFNIKKEQFNNDLFKIYNSYQDKKNKMEMNVKKLLLE